MTKIFTIILLFLLSFSVLQADSWDFSPEYQKNIDIKISKILENTPLIAAAKFNHILQNDFSKRFSDPISKKHADYFTKRYNQLFTNFLFSWQTLKIDDIKQLTAGVRTINGQNEFREQGKIFVVQKIDNALPISTNSLIPFFLMNNIWEYYFYESSVNGQFIAKDITIIESAKNLAPWELQNLMLEKINTLRAEKNISPLKLNDTLNTAAQNFAHDMYENSFYSHTTPNGLTPKDRIYGLWYKKNTIAENIAKGQINIDEALNSWMDSAPHKKNILDPNLDEIGIGFDNYFWVQNFGGNTFIEK